MKPLNICVLSGSILAVSAFISADHACAQREIDYELHTQTMFDWSSPGQTTERERLST